MIPIDSPHLTAFVLSGLVWQLHIYTRKRNMKMANSPENGLVSAGAILCVDSHVKFGWLYLNLFVKLM